MPSSVPRRPQSKSRTVNNMCVVEWIYIMVFATGGTLRVAIEMARTDIEPETTKYYSGAITDYISPWEIDSHLEPLRRYKYSNFTFPNNMGVAEWITDGFLGVAIEICSKWDSKPRPSLSRAHASTRATSLIRVKNSTRHFCLWSGTYCLGHWNEKNEIKIKRIKLNN